MLDALIVLEPDWDMLMELEPAAAADVEEAAPLLQVAAVGTCTPAMLQMFAANWMVSGMSALA